MRSLRGLKYAEQCFEVIYGVHTVLQQETALFGRSQTGFDLAQQPPQAEAFTHQGCADKLLIPRRRN